MSDFSHLSVGIEDRFVPQGSVTQLLELLKMDEISLSERIKEFVK